MHQSSTSRPVTDLVPNVSNEADLQVSIDYTHYLGSFAYGYLVSAHAAQVTFRSYLGSPEMQLQRAKNFI